MAEGSLKVQNAFGGKIWIRLALGLALGLKNQNLKFLIANSSR